MNISAEVFTSHSDRPNMAELSTTGSMDGDEIVIGLRWRSDMKPTPVKKRWEDIEGRTEYYHSIQFPMSDFLPFARAVVAAYG